MAKKKKRKYNTVSPDKAERAERACPAAPAASDVRVKVGDVVLRRPITFFDRDSDPRSGLTKGKVVYVHPKGRFHVVEFGEGRRAVRESFAGV